MAESLGRRRFLVASAASLGAGLALRDRVRSSPVPTQPFTLGFSLYGMKSLPIEKALKTCADIGYRDVEPALLEGFDTEPTKLSAARRKEVRSLLDSLGLRVPAVMENIRPAVSDDAQQTNLEKIARAAELAHEWAPKGAAAKPVIETVLGGKPEEWKAYREPMLAGLRSWAAAAKKSDVVIAIKAHVAGAMHTPEDTVAVVRELNSPNLRAVYDFSHFERQGMDLEKSVRTLLPETVFIHVKDGRGKPGGKFEFLLPGEGETDYVKYFRILRELNYSGSVTVEVSAQIHQKPGYEPASAARKSYEALSRAYVASAG